MKSPDFMQYTFAPISKKKIADLEKRFHVKLPEDYKTFLRQIGGGVVDTDKVRPIPIPQAEDGGEPVVIDLLFGEDPQQHKAANISVWMEGYQYDMLDNSVVIGTSIMHGFFAIICEGDYQGVYYWDDTYHYKNSNDEHNTYWIADSFQDFLQLLS